MEFFIMLQYIFRPVMTESIGQLGLKELMFYFAALKKKENKINIHIYINKAYMRISLWIQSCRQHDSHESEALYL